MGKLIEKILHPQKRSKQPDGIKSFREQQKKDGAYSGVDLGIKEVPLEMIIGSVGRYRDFDNQFRMKRNVSSSRLKKIKELMLEGKALPPVKLFQIKEEYYVLDGNHRVSAAKEFGHDYINAHIVEFLPSRNRLENILYREKSEFKTQTGLNNPIDLTEIGKYAYLLKQINEHQEFLDSADTEELTIKKAAADWYDTIYWPLITIIRKSHLPDSFPKRTVADLYTYISFHQWEKGRQRKYGIGIDQLIPKNMEAFRAKMANKGEIELPEMKHRISAFILMTVKAGRELRVMDKLFGMDEVMEVHSIHGEFDLLAKISLERELLTSDAEMIGQVVYRKVRRISDVISTQTLIPSTSMTK